MVFVTLSGVEVLIYEVFDCAQTDRLTKTQLTTEMSLRVIFEA